MAATSELRYRRLAVSEDALVVERRDGRATFRCTISPSDEKISDGVRAEIRMPHRAVNGEERWYRFATLVPENFPVEDGNRVVLSQWHERMPPGVACRRPPLAHRLYGEDLLVALWSEDLIEQCGSTGPGQILVCDRRIRRGVFHEFIYRIAWFPDSRGRATGWRRIATGCAATGCAAGWRRFVDHRGAIGYPAAQAYYFKMGIYTTHPFARGMTVHHRDFADGPTAASVGVAELAPLAMS